MKVIYGIGKVKSVMKNTVLAIGVFDGVHQGHQMLLRRALQKAKEIGGKVMVMTFAPHPVHVLCPEKEQSLLTSLIYKLKFLEKLDVAVCVVVHFTKRFAAMAPEDFIKCYLLKSIAPKEIFVGNDFRFGKDRRGTLDYFQEMGRVHGFNVNVVNPSTNKDGKKKIGSTIIRHFIMEGKLGLARKCLGRSVEVVGCVVRGDGRGKTLGFPTANILIKKEVVPPEGVYAVYVRIARKRYAAMVNIGYRPSFQKKIHNLNIEVHILDFKKNIYGKEIVIEFIKKIRIEKKFSSKEALVAQIHRDELKVRKILPLPHIS
ncbi:FMN adenylyltransferase / Riboflavin kinase [hydrothermal vent metagenome]|uniref:Bifunctional riboflavin kinase/FMN adenylyltransferase n=1 Tax=hydrothermal vent metagenome TaxID=652676 RepID=A0A3B1DGZ3_9ZZZZ